MIEQPSPNAGSILVLNAGSSSLKVPLLRQSRTGDVLAQGTVRRVGAPPAILELAAFGDDIRRDGLDVPDHATALGLVLDTLRSIRPDWAGDLCAGGHRIVHGGALYTEPILITPEVEANLDELRELAPLHNGRAVEVVKAALKLLPDVPQIACFDTMFHAHLPPESARYALPRELSNRLGIRRYGFHGLSCAWSMQRLRALEGTTPERVIICHLGAGASVTAVLRGRSIDTTMGFTPLEGLIMATRSGSIDPSIVLYLQRHAGMGPDDVERVLEDESGLLGLTGRSGDVQLLEDATRSGDLPARDALSAFAYRVRLAIGSFWAALEGLDVLVLTGGIGEHGREMRRRILAPLRGMGLELDEKANEALDAGTEGRLSSSAGRPAIWMIPAHEEQIIAEYVVSLLAAEQPAGR